MIVATCTAENSKSCRQQSFICSKLLELSNICDVATISASIATLLQLCAELVMSSGSEFYNLAAMMGKAWSPSVERRVAGTINLLFVNYCYQSDADMPQCGRQRRCVRSIR